MHVTRIGLCASPLSSQRVRLRADVAYDDSSPSEEYWFDVPSRFAAQLSCGGNPWLALCVPLAIHLGEPLRIDARVDETLLDNIAELMAVWSCWYPQLKPVPIEVDKGPATYAPGKRRASLFSGGVDAWFTLLRHTAASPERRLDDCLTIWGLDITLGNPGGFDRMRRAAQQAAAACGVEVVELATNLRDTRWWRDANWGTVGHGCALASFGLALERRLKSLAVPSSHRYTDLVPWGSHPLTDPLLSSSSLRVIHDGAAFTRVDKTRFLLDHQVALNLLQVCWATDTYENCGRCSKCLRTMATLTMLGALDRCPTFKATSLDPKALRGMVPHHEGDRAFYRELRDLAVEKDRSDFLQVIDRDLAWSRAIALIKRVTDRQTTHGGVRVLQQQIRHLGRLVLGYKLTEW